MATDISARSMYGMARWQEPMVPLEFLRASYDTRVITARSLSDLLNEPLQFPTTTVAHSVHLL